MRRLILASLLALPLAALAQTPVTDVAGVKYEHQIDVNGQKLQLNGAGIRYRAIFKVYAAGLYLSNPVNTPEAVLSQPGVKRLHVVALRNIDGNDLGKAFTTGVEKNATREEFAKAINGVLNIAGLFASKKGLPQGESFDIDWIPGVGTVTSINGKPQGEPIKEPEFFNVLMKIWLGKSPADDQLKDALLGVKRSGRS